MKYLAFLSVILTLASCTSGTDNIPTDGIVMIDQSTPSPRKQEMPNPSPQPDQPKQESDPLPPPPADPAPDQPQTDPAPVTSPTLLCGDAFLPFTGTEERLSGGVASVDSRFHASLRQQMYDRNRTGYRMVNGPIQEGNTFLPWVTVWGDGQVRLRRLELLHTDANGVDHVVYTQTWSNNENIAGGHWRNTQTRWYAELLALDVNLPIFRRDNGDVIIDTRGKPDEVHHVWLSTWPHPTVPAGTTRIGVRAVYAVYGNALMHFGCDRYAHDNVTRPQMSGPECNVQEILHSQTYSESHNSGSTQDRTLWTNIGRR